MADDCRTPKVHYRQKVVGDLVLDERYVPIVPPSIEAKRLVIETSKTRETMAAELLAQINRKLTARNAAVPQCGKGCIPIGEIERKPPPPPMKRRDTLTFKEPCRFKGKDKTFQIEVTFKIGGTVMVETRVFDILCDAPLEDAAFADEPRTYYIDDEIGPLVEQLTEEDRKRFGISEVSQA